MPKMSTPWKSPLKTIRIDGATVEMREGEEEVTMRCMSAAVKMMNELDHLPVEERVAVSENVYANQLAQMLDEIASHRFGSMPEETRAKAIDRLLKDKMERLAYIIAGAVEVQNDKP